VGNSIRSSNVKGFKRCVCYLSINVSIYVRTRRPLTYFIVGRTAPGPKRYASFYHPIDSKLRLCVCVRLSGPEKMGITQSGAAYEKYGAKGLNDVCIAAISLILRATDSSFACRCLSYPKRKLQIYHCSDRTLFAFYEWPKGFENMYFWAHKKCDQ